MNTPAKNRTSSANIEAMAADMARIITRLRIVATEAEFNDPEIRSLFSQFPVRY